MDYVFSSAIQAIIEKSIVGASFIYLLYYTVNKNNKALELISSNLEVFGRHLERVSDTLLRIDRRVEMLEDRINNLEGKK